MKFDPKKPKQSLNKAYLKEKLSRSAIELFKKNFQVFLENTSKNKNDEEHLKSQVIYFLRDTWYQDSHQINPIGKNDLVIHNGKNTSDTVGVIVEVKSITNKAEMIGLEKPNAKAFHELVLYYLRERIDNNNNEIKFLLATNIEEWFVIDANEFDKKIFRNTAIKRLYELKKTDNKDNPWFYDELKKVLQQQEELKLEITHFNIHDFEKIVSNNSQSDDSKLISVYKLLSPVHLLKLPFANDSNSLQPRFYAELLHIIGLTEVKEGSKKLIRRKAEGERNNGSLLENTIIALDTHDKISRLDKPSQYGDNYQDRLFSVALELVITWVNRILFLKLLEAQLASYHKGDRSYRFLSKEKIKDFDDLDKLFFSVLAKRNAERRPEIQQLFGKVPYLNSSLFEPTDLEHQTLFIYGLEDRVDLPLINSTVLKNEGGKTLKGSLHTIDYLFAFLDAYDFSSEGAEEIQEDNKTLINASVLGLIFEKINGYKDGSFFTPGFITMYMCRETLRRAVVQKFNEVKGWELKEYDELYDKINDSREANGIINSLKICDPAVGSGHFLVSALNELLAIKSDLRILLDREGKRLKEYNVEVVNDELVVTDEEGQLFDYKPGSRESQRIQETLFHEKQTLIENCLFGVDINPNSVKICRLRLWIELLKNAYYRSNGELETLPNIDINIKTGNSLISRFALDADLKQALKKSRFSIDAYKIAVQTYRNAKDKEEKREMEGLIASIKSDFRSEINRNDPKLLRLNRLSGELYNLTNQQQLFGESRAEAKLRKGKVEKLGKEISVLNTEVEEIKSNKIYENAFEWRFEFPEVLNDEGDFVGFDVVIGNPPYVPGKELSLQLKLMLKSAYKSSVGKFDLYISFIERASSLVRRLGNCSLIIPNTFLTNENAISLRTKLLSGQLIKKVIVLDASVFAEAFVESLILEIEDSMKDHFWIYNKDFNPLKCLRYGVELGGKDNRILIGGGEVEEKLLQKIELSSIKLGTITDFCIGIQLGGEGDSKDFKAKYISNSEEGPEYKKVIDGKDFGFLTIKWPGKYVKYGNWLHRKRDERFFLSPKIIIRQIGATPVSTLDFDQYYTLNTIYNCILTNHNFNIKYVFAILNCKVSEFFWKKRFSDGKTLFPKIKKSQLLEIPVPAASITTQEMIGLLIDECEIGKKLSLALLSQIDQLVYQLYGLTEEEIKIVEGEV